MIVPFMKIKWVTILISILSMAYLFFNIYQNNQGFKLGLDFSGGLKLEIALNKVITIKSLREFFGKKKIKVNILLVGKTDDRIAKIELDAKTDASFELEAKKNSQGMNKFGLSANSVDYVKYILIKQFTPKFPNQIKIVSADKVGPTVGHSLRKSSLKLLFITLILIAFYVSFRFHFNFAVGATIALIHDLLMTIGLIGYFQIPLSIPVVAALLTILGYSINDTIVIFDRVRENLTKDTHKFERIIDKSITESISRTLITSLTTLFSVFSVYLYGGKGLKEMALVLILGIAIGTYSSSFIASPMVIFLNRRSKSENR